MCTGLVEGVEHMLQEDTGDVTSDIQKVYHQSNHILYITSTVIYI